MRARLPEAERGTRSILRFASSAAAVRAKVRSVRLFSLPDSIWAIIGWLTPERFARCLAEASTFAQGRDLLLDQYPGEFIFNFLPKTDLIDLFFQQCQARICRPHLAP